MKLFYDIMNGKEFVQIKSMRVGLTSGKTIDITWDESDISYDDCENFSTARCKGVYFNDEYANGRISELRGNIATVNVILQNRAGEQSSGNENAIIGMSFVDHIDGFNGEVKYDFSSNDINFDIN